MNPLAWILLAVVALVLVAIAIEWLTERRERREYPPPGRLVDIGGYRLHLLDTGVGQPGTDGPTRRGDGLLLLELGVGAARARQGRAGGRLRSGRSRLERSEGRSRGTPAGARPSCTRPSRQPGSQARMSSRATPMAG